MKPRTISIAGVALTLAFLLGISHILGVHADNRPGRIPCSNGTLIGSYGFYRTGFNDDGPLAAVGIITYDGNGNFKVSQRVVRNSVLDTKGKILGQYTVASDCTTKSFFNGDENAFGVVVDNGNGVYFLGESGSNTVYGVQTKIQQQ